MKQTQELMTQGHADEQSPDYAVTQMSKDVERLEFMHHTKMPSFKGLLSVPQHGPCRVTLGSTCLRLSVHVLQCAVLQNPEPQGHTCAWFFDYKVQSLQRGTQRCSK